MYPSSTNFMATSSRLISVAFLQPRKVGKRSRVGGSTGLWACLPNVVCTVSTGHRQSEHASIRDRNNRTFPQSSKNQERWRRYGTLPCYHRPVGMYSHATGMLSPAVKTMLLSLSRAEVMRAGGRSPYVNLWTQGHRYKRGQPRCPQGRLKIVGNCQRQHGTQAHT